MGGYQVFTRRNIDDETQTRVEDAILDSIGMNGGVGSVVYQVHVLHRVLRVCLLVAQLLPVAEVLVRCWEPGPAVLPLRPFGRGAMGHPIGGHT